MLTAAEIGKKKRAKTLSACAVMPRLSPGRLGGLFTAFINSVLNCLSFLVFIYLFIFPEVDCFVLSAFSSKGPFARAKLSKRCSFSAGPRAWWLLRTQPTCHRPRLAAVAHCPSPKPRVGLQLVH